MKILTQDEVNEELRELKDRLVSFMNSDNPDMDNLNMIGLDISDIANTYTIRE